MDLRYRRNHDYRRAMPEPIGTAVTTGPPSLVGSKISGLRPHCPKITEGR